MKSQLCAMILAIVLGLLAAACWLYGWLGYYPSHEAREAQKVWHATTAQVVSVSDVKGSASSPYRVATLSYRDLADQMVKGSAILPYTERVGQKEPIAISQSGPLWVKNQIGQYYDPRHPEDINIVLMAVFTFWLPGLIIGFLVYWSCWLVSPGKYDWVPVWSDNS